MSFAAVCNSAIHFHPEGFNLDGKIMGRMAAGKGFLEGFLRHGEVDAFYCFAQSQGHFSRFARQAAKLAPAERPCRWIPQARPEGLARPGCLFRPDPVIAVPAWQRRFMDIRAYSICGLTHTLCTEAAMDAVGALLIAPVQPWDALICTSRAALQAIACLLDQWGEYLRARMSAVPLQPVLLRVVPLGVDCRAFAATERRRAAGRDLRARLGIGADEPVVLYAGRISAHSKANPLPMYLALEQAAGRTNRRVHLIEAGLPSAPGLRQQYAAAAARFCPTVRRHFIDGRSRDFAAVWHASDIFTSLSDNLQETFGLTPIEAMAAGLPLVVSDWDGYADTVRHGIDGYRIPTTMPPAGAGMELARRYFLGQDNYDHYIARASQCTGVDVRQTAEAYVRLIEEPAIRRRMGAAGETRARECFDWSVVVRAYQELWRELRELRLHAPSCGPQGPQSFPHPLRADPFAVFAHYVTRPLRLEQRVYIVAEADRARLNSLWTLPIMSFAQPVLISKDECAAILDRLSKEPCGVGRLLEDEEISRHAALLRTLGWLAKAGLVRIEDPPVSPSEEASQGSGN